MKNNEVALSVTSILGGALLQMFYGFGHTWACSLAVIFGFVMFLSGLQKLKNRT